MNVAPIFRFACHFVALGPPSEKRSVKFGAYFESEIKYGQMVADRAKLCISRYLEVMIGLSIGATLH